ncbi:MAG TPA: hypothetical protein VJY65_00910 [Chloroflexota bacterium]|nr:hypothetical protein [Chloroflexota bacterium]
MSQRLLPIGVIEARRDGEGRHRVVRHEDLAAMDALDGLLRAACGQGQVEIGWGELCALCEDAVVAAAFDNWDLHPHEAEAVVGDLAMRLAVHVVHHYGQHYRPSHMDTETGEMMFSVLDLLRTLGTLAADRGDTWVALETA